VERITSHSPEQLSVEGYERVLRCKLGPRGLTCFIVIHSTARGPAIGTVRMSTYATEEAALSETLNLAREMTYRACVAGLDCGGAKAIIVGNPTTEKSEALFRDFGAVVDSLEGKLIITPDLGIALGDLAMMGPTGTRVASVWKTQYNPANMTALGVFASMKACCEYVYGDPRLKNRTVVVHGAGRVGSRLTQELVHSGAQVIVGDIDQRRADLLVSRFSVKTCSPADIYDQDCDIFAPCARGGILNERTIPRLKCRIIVGSARSQLSNPGLANDLFARGICYVPDYVANAGSLIDITTEQGAAHAERASHKVKNIGDRVAQILKVSDLKGTPPQAITDRMVADMLSNARLGR